MNTATDPSELDGVPPAAEDAATTPFDYIIVGSGAGGAPLACRLARAGMRVLVLEAGVDPGAPLPEDPQDTKSQRDAENQRAIYHCPGFHGASSEPNQHAGTADDLQMSWDFEVRHYSDDTIQDADPKAGPDPYVAGRKSVFYPRCASLGGCTSHHSMVTVYGTDREWQRIAELTGDPSWSPQEMHGYFKRLSRASYGRYRTHIGKLWQHFLDWLKPPRDSRNGWLDITITDPQLAMKDKQLLKFILNAALDVEVKGLRSVWRWLKRMLAGRFYRDLDPNDVRKIHKNLEGVAFVPLAVSKGGRHGPRELLLQTQRDLQGSKETGALHIATGVFVKRVIFADGNGADPPRAIGVEYALGRHLYQASPLHNGSETSQEGQCFARSEVILCGGAFNTPQLLMLSGIGDKSQLERLEIRGPRDREGRPVDEVIDLPGVGKNLRDRYEVSVITEMEKEFSTLEGVRFDPTSTEDPALKLWKKKRTGLYGTNGAAIAILKKSRQVLSEPDLFIFGFPAAFRGYYHGWSKELLKASMGAGDQQPLRRNLWSWAILKAYSSNQGQVSLRSSNPFETPEINFHYFQDGCGEATEDPDPDLEAVVTAVSYTRYLNQKASDLIKNRDPRLAEIQPGCDIQDGSESLRKWIKQNAWGHHACGTCRIGQDPWRASVAALADEHAVIDSKFRVHGVRGLRIVDASIFPEIPGYFIVTPVYMVSEKAADTLLADSTTYPPALERAEAATIQTRRTAAKASLDMDSDIDRLPHDAVGLALSGGGIRSATFGLGVLQALAQRGRLREVDFLSTISGGGYIGSFLGRLFTRQSISDPDPCQAVQDILRDNQSAPIRWLRSNANYIAGAGRSDLLRNLAAYWRNLFTLYLIFALFGLAVFGLLRLISDLSFPEFLRFPVDAVDIARFVAPSVLSPWWWLPLAIFFIAVVPASLAYWLAPKPRTQSLLSFFPAAGWLTLLGGLAIGATLPGGTVPCTYAGIVVLITGVWLEVARLHSRKEYERLGKKDPDWGALLRNRLTRGLAAVTGVFLLAIGWIVIDTLARAVAQQQIPELFAAWAALLASVLPIVGKLWRLLARGRDNRAGKRRAFGSGRFLAAMIAFPLAALLLVLADGIVHELFDYRWIWGVAATILGVALTVVFGMAFDLLNFSSLQPTYAARLARTFLGASNPQRIHATAEDACADVQQIEAEDNISFHKYHPETLGGPLHLIGVCLNETVDVASHRDIRDRKGFLMSVGPCGLSVGRRYHALWSDPPKNLPWSLRMRQKLDSDDSLGRRGAAAHGVPVPGQSFHMLRGKDDRPIPVESLDLGAWVSISGAAFSTGTGRNTSLPMSLLAGLANVRLGYWWDTRLEAWQRPGTYRQNAWRRIKSLPARLARTQSLLLAELQGKFPGPNSRFWYLSDGGHFDHTGIYELVRRRTPLILAVDAGADPQRTFATSGDLIRQVRIDFAADVEYLEPKSAADDNNGSQTGDQRVQGWAAFDEPNSPVPDLVKKWIHPDSLGGLGQLGVSGGKHAALARITYADDPEAISWLVLLKATVTDDENLDIKVYKTLHPDFPNESTADQFFDEAQWESYRKLGEITGLEVLEK